VSHNGFSTSTGSQPVALPELVTVQGIQAELGVSRAEAERIMRLVPRRIQFVERGRVYTYRADVVDLLRKHEAAA
jgi:hypothetical protein